ncbi:MAG: hypothetical protein JL50_03140 [Peptococcaceae bacterium BICA1-7]|nr:MAG: hypothetical protein JL50_03140 [Peptococcaceae bacterium BICA1-7]HBV97740.1 hypothetical protein [Desulfotomaculum sp.]
MKEVRLKSVSLNTDGDPVALFSAVIKEGDDPKSLARLYTAAPELLEAAKKALKVLERLSCDWCIQEDADAFTALDNAITKAQGK